MSICRETMAIPAHPAVPALRRMLAGTTALTAAAVCGWMLAADPAWALPTDGTVVEGQAEIIYGQDSVTIQQGSDRVIIEWQTFDVDVHESVNFVQPHELAAALNRVLSGDASQILGSLTANGQVIISNPAGVVFGPEADVDVQSIVATSLNIMNRPFMDTGRLDFQVSGLVDEGVRRRDAALNAMVVNEGSIRADELVAIVAPGVRNSGVIVANVAIMGAGEAAVLDPYGDGLINFAITSPTTMIPINMDGSEAEALVVNSEGATILADGGQVILTADTAAGVIDNVINLDGVVVARRIDASGGQVALVGGDEGAVIVAGSIDASGVEEDDEGGTVHVLGETVVLADGAEVDVSGPGRGGTALVGGAERGGPLAAGGHIAYAELAPSAGGGTAISIDVIDTFETESTIPTADYAYVEAGSEIIARGTAEEAEGGTVVVWGTQEVQFHGTINTGFSGFVEVSTRVAGTIAGSVTTGQMLVDPGDVCISAGNTSGCAAGATDVAFSTIRGVLNTGGHFELNTDVVGDNAGTGRVDFGGLAPLYINNNSGTVGTFEIHASDTIDTNQVVIENNGANGTNFEWYAGSSKTGGPVASADIILGPQRLETGGGHVILDAADDVQLSDPLRTGGGDVTVIARGGDSGARVVIGAEGVLNDEYIDTADGAGNAGAITVQTDELFINPGINNLDEPGVTDPIPAVVRADGVGGIVTFRPTTDGRTINLGTDVAGSLSLTDGEIDLMLADILRIGSTTSGSITITDAISPANIYTLSLITGGDVVDGNATDPDITVTNLAIQSSGNVGGGAGGPLETAVTNLAFQNSSNALTGSPGFLQIANTGALTIAQVDGLVSSSNSSFAGVLTQISATELLRFAVDTSIGGFAEFVAPTITVQDTDGDPDTGPAVSAGTGFVFDADTVNLFGDLLTTGGFINGTATAVNVDNETSTGTTGNGAEIQDAIGVAAAGATVTVAAGTYAEDLSITKDGLTLSGANAGLSAGPGSDPGDRGDETILVGTIDTGENAGSAVDGFTFDGFTVQWASGDAISERMTGAITIANTIFAGPGGDGVSALFAGGAVNALFDITGNAFSGHDIAIVMDGSGLDPTSVIHGNTFTDGRGAIQLFGSLGPGMTVSANAFDGQTFASVILGTSGNTITNNFFTGAGYAVANFIVTNTTVITNNSITGLGVWNDLDGATVDASGNWWGTVDETAIAAKMGDDGAEDVDFTPYLNSGTDVLADTTGFQGDFSALVVTALGEQTDAATVGRIQEGVDLAVAGGTVFVNEGRFVGGIVIDKALTLQGNDGDETVPGAGSPMLVGPGTRGSTAVTVLNVPTFTISGMDISNFDDGIDATRGGGSLTIDNNTISEVDAGVRAFNWSSVDVTYNDITLGLQYATDPLAVVLANNGTSTVSHNVLTNLLPSGAGYISFGLVVVDWQRSSGDYIVEDAAINGFDVNLRVDAWFDGTPNVTIGTGNVITGGGVGARFSSIGGGDINIVDDTLNDLSFVGLTGDFIQLRSGVEFAPGFPTLIDVSGVNFDGLNQSSPVGRAIIEERVVHFPDTSNSGLLVFSTLTSPAAVGLPTDVETLVDDIQGAQSQLDRPGGASFFSNELGAPFQTDVFAEAFSIGAVGGPGGLQPAAGGETGGESQGPVNLGDLEPAAGPGSQQAQAEDTCVETYFADFWNVDTACQ